MRISDCSSDVCSSDLVSVAAARSIWNKLEQAVGPGVPQDVLLSASDERLREAGLSRQKISYARSLAGQVATGTLDLERLPEDDEQAVALLTGIKGIGRWSAEIYLLFAEGRPDIWPAGDLARSEEHTSELQSLMRISYAVFCLKKKKQIQ